MFNREESLVSVSLVGGEGPPHELLALLESFEVRVLPASLLYRQVVLVQLGDLLVSQPTVLRCNDFVDSLQFIRSSLGYLELLGKSATACSQIGPNLHWLHVLSVLEQMLLRLLFTAMVLCDLDLVLG